jgi:hypothetical protein
VIFKFAEKKITLDCFACQEIILQTAPIDHAVKYLPQWWKNLPSATTYEHVFYPIPNMKKCSGLLDYYKNSITIPLWSDLAIKVENRNYEWQFSDRRTHAIIHEYEQRINFLPDYGHFKITSPWFLKTKSKLNWVWSVPTYNFAQEIIDIKMVPGILDFHSQGSTNINLFVPLNKNKVYVLKQGQPMVNLTPMFEGKVNIVRHLVSKEEFNNMTDGLANITFTNKYRNIISKKKQFSDCPYQK